MGAHTTQRLAESKEARLSCRISTNKGDIIIPTVDIDGIATHYEISGSGPPILLMAPGGFDSAIEKWSTTWPWQHFLPLQAFARDYTCIAYDRREAGQSGGRVEHLTWDAYADQAKGLLDHLGLTSAFIMGSCLGCSPVIAFAARDPQACRGLLLAQPSGGVKRRLAAHRHFDMHRHYVQDNGLEAVVELAREGVDLAIVSRSREQLEQTARELADETGRRVIPLAADVTSKAQVDGMVAQAAERLGGLHILVNSASFLASEKAWAITGELIVANGGAGQAVYY
jgi:pimeloyl-ACP methyl ester carboxylesterase